MSRKHAALGSRVVIAKRAWESSGSFSGFLHNCELTAPSVKYHQDRKVRIKILKNRKKKAVKQQHFELKGEKDLTAACLHQNTQVQQD